MPRIRIVVEGTEEYAYGVGRAIEELLRLYYPNHAFELGSASLRPVHANSLAEILREITGRAMTEMGGKQSDWCIYVLAGSLTLEDSETGAKRPAKLGFVAVVHPQGVGDCLAIPFGASELPTRAASALFGQAQAARQAILSERVGAPSQNEMAEKMAAVVAGIIHGTEGQA